MGTYNLQLLDFPGIYGKGKAPWGPRAYIALKAHATVKWQSKNGKKEIDFPVISQESVNADEFHYHVQRLIKELQEIDKKATRFFAKDAEKRAAWIEARKSKKGK